MFLSVCVFSKYECKKIIKWRYNVSFVCAWMLNDYKTEIMMQIEFFEAVKFGVNFTKIACLFLKCII